MKNNLQKKFLRNILALLVTIITFSFVCVKNIYAQVPSLSFSPLEILVDQGDTFTIEIVVDTAGEDVGGVGAKLAYDPSKISVLSVEQGSIFSEYPALTSDDVRGKIYVSGIVSSANDLYVGRGVLATIEMLAKSEGSTFMIFEYEEGSTRDSNIAVMYGNGDILKEVNNLRIAIGDVPIPEEYDYETGGGTVGEWFGSENAGIVNQEQENGVVETDMEEEGGGGFIDTVLKKLGLRSSEVLNGEALEGAESDKEAGNRTLLYVIIFAVIAIFLTVIVVIIVKRRRKKKETSPPPTVIGSDI
jgi:hypothetical protein